MSLHADARAVLAAFEHSDIEQCALRDEYRAFLGSYPDAMWRSCRIGHLTASALVMDASGARVLLTLHPRVGRWLQLGGHCEPSDGTLQEAARREVIEECGIAPVRMSRHPLRLDRHAVSCGPGTSEHLDVQFLAIVPDAAIPVISEESDDLRWWSVDALPAGTDASVLALVREACDRGASGCSL
ncbi:MAG: NUDIX hydrolase [Actinomycetales bacterium]|nr:NUDIX hydrolase [Actinomycetales bacterium]